MRKLFFMFFFCSCFLMQAQQGFYSRFTVSNKTDEGLKQIETKLIESLKKIKQANKYPLPYQVYMPYSNWRSECTLNEIFLDEKAEPTNNYEVYIEWRNQRVDSGYVTGYSKIYRHEVKNDDGASRAMLQPLNNIPLGEYTAFINPTESQLLCTTIQSDLAQKLNLYLSGKNYFSLTQVNMEDSSSSYNHILLKQLSKAIMGTVFYGNIVYYKTPQLTNALTNSEKEALFISKDTIASPEPGVSAILTDHLSPRAFEIVNTWQMIRADPPEKKKNYIPELLRITRKISAIGVVVGNKKLYFSYSDFWKLAKAGSLDAGIYDQLFNTKSIEAIPLKLEIN